MEEFNTGKIQLLCANCDAIKTEKNMDTSKPKSRIIDYDFVRKLLEIAKS